MPFLVPVVICAVLALSPVLQATPSSTVPDTCPVTIPNGIAPSGEQPRQNWHTADEFSTWVPANGVYSAMREDNGGWSKHGWQPIEEPDRFTVSFAFVGQRATDEAPSAEYTYPAGNPLSPAAVYELRFPEAGCWTITGSSPTTSISFTTWVVFIDDWATPAT